MTTEPKPSVARRLFALSRNICYYERCEEKLASPEWPRLNCDIAHIAGESIGAAADVLQRGAWLRGLIDYVEINRSRPGRLDGQWDPKAERIAIRWRS